MRILVVILAFLLLSACASAPRNIVGTGQFAGTSQLPAGATLHRVFVATTRRQSSDPAEFFSGERARNMSFGYLDVSVPRLHQPGTIERPRGNAPDPYRHFLVSQPHLVGSAPSFTHALDGALEQRSGDDKSILVFVHGYNVNFSAAVLRVAQFVHDTGYRGVPVLFSWASRGRRLDYIYDLNSALQARNELERLGTILAGAQTNHFDVVAHSMGNLVTIEAMRNLERRQDIESRGRLRQVILASPDIDIDLFEAQLDDLAPIVDRVTVLVSEDDRALRLSRRIAGGVSRVGAADPFRLSQLGVTVIDLTQVEDGSSAHHTKFASSPEIVQLIGRGILAGNTLSAQTEQPAGSSLFADALRDISIISGAGAARQAGSAVTAGAQ